VFVPTALFWYRPAARDWVFDVKTTGVAMDFYGRCSIAGLASAVGGGAAYAVVRWRARRDPSALAVGAMTACALATVVVAIAFFAWRLGHRELAAPPIPSWYELRRAGIAKVGSGIAKAGSDIAKAGSGARDVCEEHREGWLRARDVRLRAREVRLRHASRAGSLAPTARYDD
jgi:hypothetical protein